MKIINKIIDYPTDTSIGIYNLRDRLETEIAAAGITNGHVLVFSRHTTTAIAINEYEERLLEDIKVYLSKLAPEAIDTCTMICTCAMCRRMNQLTPIPT
jgi:thiamine phosphate synthase YjbQ (UPF0047 family)